MPKPAGNTLWLSSVQYSTAPVRRKRLDRLVLQVRNQAATETALENLFPGHAQREFVAMTTHECL